MSLRIFSGILTIPKRELNLRPCLRGGMSFRWSILSDTDDQIEFVGVIKHRIYKLNQIYSKNHIEYTMYYNQSNEENEAHLNDSINLELKDYFRLNENLDKLYKEWSDKDSKFKERITMYPEVLGGIRQLRLDPVENLFSFICSSNNNIKRITQMVQNMCLHFGEKIGELNDGSVYHAFPTIERLAQNDVEEKLRKLNFGYRAKYISKAANYINTNYSTEWLYSLRDKPYVKVTEELTKICGIGKKVADCICLMSMDKLEAVPVDTHVLNIAKNTYNFAKDTLSNKNDLKKTNNLTDKSYKAIGECFRNLWGDYAGWAQTIMFIDDLKGFQKEKSYSLLVKSESQSNLVSSIKIEPNEAKEEEIAHEKEVKGDYKRKGTKRSNVVDTNESVKNLKKKKSL